MVKGGEDDSSPPLPLGVRKGFISYKPYSSSEIKRSLRKQALSPPNRSRLRGPSLCTVEVVLPLVVTHGCSVNLVSARQLLKPCKRFISRL